MAGAVESICCAEDVWDGLTAMDAALDGTGRIILLYSGYVIEPGTRDHEHLALLKVKLGVRACWMVF